MGVDISQDPSVQVLEQSTRPAKLVEQIERAIDTTEQESEPKP